MEAIAAVLTEMEIVIAVLYTDGRRFGAVGITLAAIQAQIAKVAHFDLAERLTAVGTQMVVPIGIFNTVFAAGAAFAFSVIPAAEYAQTAIIAQLNAGLIQTFIALLTDDTAFLTVIVSKVTLCIRSVAVAALLAVHIFEFPAPLAEAAAVAKTAHTVSTEPTVTAQFIFRGVVAFVTAKAVPTVIDIAILAATACGTIVCQLVAGAALAAVGG